MPSLLRRLRVIASVTISERYIHPRPEGQERAFEWFAMLNQTAVEKAEKTGSHYSFRYSRNTSSISCCAPVAQRLEQQTHNLLVRGSNPCGGTKKIYFRDFERRAAVTIYYELNRQQ